MNFIIRKLFWPRRKHRSRNPLFKWVVGVPSMVLIAMLSSFFLFDEFTYQVMFLLKQNTVPSEGGDSYTTPYVYGEDWSTPPTSLNASAGSTLVPGEVGLRAMYVNKMGSSYYKEQLQIIKGHVSGEYMAPDAEKLYDVNRQEIHLPVSIVLGVNLCEFSSDTFGNTTSPKTLLHPNNWRSTGYMNLSNLNSFVFRENPNMIPNGTTRSLRGSGGYYTPFQFSKGYANLYPDETIYDSGHEAYKPSLMKGYSVTGTREVNEKDGAYYPDQVAIMIQHNNRALHSGANRAALTANGRLAAIFAVYNAGAGDAASLYGLGTRQESSENYHFRGKDYSKSQGANHLESSAEAFNNIATWCDEILVYLMKNPLPADNSVFHIGNHDDYGGLATMSGLLNGCFIASNTVLSNIKASYQNAGFKRGALLAYKVFKDANATNTDVEAYINNLHVQQVDTDFYGPLYGGKRLTNTVDGIVLRQYSEKYSAKNNFGAAARPLLHTYPGESFRGIFMSYVGGYLCYHDMLLAAGVECTLSDAISDALGSSSKLEPETNTGDDAKGSYYLGTRWVKNFVEGQTLPRCSSAMHYRVQFGSLHYGEDYATPNDTPLHAVIDGTVVETRTSYNKYVGAGDGSFGNYVKIEWKSTKEPGDRNMTTLYAHLADVYVKVGDKVKEGDVIGTTGNSGGSFGPHLHIELRTNISGINYVFPFRAVFERRVVPVVSPAVRVIYPKNGLPGEVYNGSGHYLGVKLKPTGRADGNLNSQTEYYSKGLMRYILQAEEAG